MSTEIIVGIVYVAIVISLAILYAIGHKKAMDDAYEKLNSIYKQKESQRININIRGSSPLPHTAVQRWTEKGKTMASEKRLIDAEAIARKLKNANCAECNIVRQIQCSACWVNDVLELLDSDSVDAVEVVRCKDCKAFVRNSRVDTDRGDCYRYGIGCLRIKKIDDFCSYGERKDDGK